VGAPRQTYVSSERGVERVVDMNPTHAQRAARAVREGRRQASPNTLRALDRQSNNAGKGLVKGEPRAYVTGHNRTGTGKPKPEPKRKAVKLAGDKPPPVVPTGLPCARAGCRKPALGDTYCSRACCKLDHGVSYGAAA
jgi:hypothetical protein